MPLVRVDMISGKSPEYKKTVLDCIHIGLMESIGIEDWDRFQRIVEIPRDDFETAPEKTDDFMIIELTLFPGRTKEQKGDEIPHSWDIGAVVVSRKASDVLRNKTGICKKIRLKIC